MRLYHPCYCRRCRSETQHLWRAQADDTGNLTGRPMECQECGARARSRVASLTTPPQKSFMQHAEDFLACRTNTAAGDAANTLSWAVILLVVLVFGSALVRALLSGAYRP